MKNIVVLHERDYSLCFATVTYREIRGYECRDDLTDEIVIARSWDWLNDWDCEENKDSYTKELIKEVEKMYNSYWYSVDEIKLEYRIDGKFYYATIDCSKYRD